MSRIRDEDGNLKNKDLCGIYRIICITSGMSLVGQTTHFRIRELSHFREVETNTHKNQHFQAAYNKYGKENFTFSILEVCEESNLDDREQFWIKFYKNNGGVYNMNDGGRVCRGTGHHNFGQKRTLESRQKMSQSRLLKQIKGDKCYQYGKKMPPEFGLAISRAKKKQNLVGEKSKHYGMKRSEESRRKMSETRNRPEIKDKLIHKLRQAASTDEWRDKMDKIRRLQFKPVVKLDIETGELLDTYESVSEANRQNKKGLSITEVCKGRRKQSGGFRWMYLSEYLETINNKQCI